ncbi:MAG: hypothetical protein KGZ49_10575 [Syntrophaceae bacterium]|nr:hypothetical protein [Syntrophaceae bacterium]
MEDIKDQDAVVRNLEIIGVNLIPDKVKARQSFLHRAVSWATASCQ